MIKLSIKHSFQKVNSVILFFGIAFILFFLLPDILYSQNNALKKPNIIIIMADDLGFGDVGFNGNVFIKTPELDKMASEALVFDRFYAAAPICSPTRASVLTGRNAMRQGIFGPHTAGIRTGETTIAEILKEEGYTTGIFGKWHLGWIMPDAEVEDRGFYSPPWHHGFDESFVTKSAMPTWNPTVTPWDMWANKEGEMWTTSFYLQDKVLVKDNLAGDDSRVIMDRVVPFVEKAADRNIPFLACIWLHTPHEPVVAGPAYRAMYAQYSEEKQHYLGAITAMDEQIGRLRKKLTEMGIADDTIIWFVSDNGPSSYPTERGIASAGKFRGSKHTIYEGGIRVPSILEWPGSIAPLRTTFMATTSDMMPTLLSLIDSDYKSKVPLDGIDMTAKLKNPDEERTGYLFFAWQRLYNKINQQAIMDNQFKYLIDGGREELYDLKKDPEESNNIIDKKAEKAKELKSELAKWNKSTFMSREGSDFRY
ncbi:Steryl-sulfatase [Flagellimonas maritima]|uniref:Steryl-sulfatase n=1 Tax=Flagellimonas maritima TaxID=1383885 RepID=A0A2Z4LQ18_9FLAO|nr:sulfatase-like hydrolase/transferase [Allomuricauda aurantiaca]AWX43674.1 Steryl-sulfatase [Allomuricauda aurantiaca]